jgi:AcrR family transcriptional regulator
MMTQLVDASADAPLGLRERKKIKLRHTIQDEALRLFTEQGYEATTVEQIAAAAETSTTTFYRYFPTKEDVVLDDGYDAEIEAAIAARPNDQPLADAIREVVQTTIAAADHDRVLAALRLTATVPALDARYAAAERRTVAEVAGLLAARTGREIDDFELQIAAAALVAAMYAASRRWSSEGGKSSLAGMQAAAITFVEPLLNALEHDGEA